ncbi:MAG: tetratricopeptide repeat protein [Asticcacaulis sp.]
MIKKLCLLGLCVVWPISDAYADDKPQKTYEDCFSLPLEVLKSPPMGADWHTRLCSIGYNEYRTKDKEAAFAGYLSLAEEGYGLAQSYAAEMYEKGTGVEKDISKALFYYHKAAEQGVVAAQNNYGFIYFYGKHNIEKDRSKAIPWLQKAAEQGDSNSQTLLAEAYETGDGFAQDYAKAYELYVVAAEKGHIFAQYRLGYLYYIGKGVEVDTVEAQNWFELSAMQGVPGAQYFMGMCYIESCKGVEDDMSAYKWFYIASRTNAETPATQWLQVLEGSLSADQIEKAKAEGEAFLKAYARK